MSIPKTQKIISGLTLTAFIFSTVILPANYALAAGPYDPDGLDLSEYKLHNSSTTPDTSNTDTYLKDTNTYNLNVGTVAESMRAVVGCTGIVNKVQKNLSDLFSSGKEEPTPAGIDSFKAGTGNYKSGTDDGTSEGSYSSFDTNSITSGISAVPTTDSSVGANTKSTKDNTSDIKKTEAQNKLRDDCLNGIAYSLAKNQLSKMTQITVNWINSGFSGDPLFLRDRESYFQSIADGQLLNLVGPLASIQNRYIYPFGRSVARSLIGSQKSIFEKRAQSTLGKSLKQGATTESFANDFSEGGWNGWFSLTQNDQNNPLGFGIMTSQELADRIAKKEEAATAELLEGKGVLSQKKCVDDKYAVNKRADDGSPADPADNGTLGRECQHWETVTPGSLIQEQASSSLTSSTRQLELADSLNESLSAVFQALVNQMVNKGLSSLSSFSPENAPKAFGGEGFNKLYDSLGNDVTNLGIDSNSGGKVLSVNKGAGWYDKDAAFNITTDLGDIRKVANGKSYIYKKGIITIQKEYGESVKQSLATLPKILPALGELDYCIPGPNASWETPTKERINQIIEYLQSLYFSNGITFQPFEDPLKPYTDFANDLSPGFSFVYGFIARDKQKYEASLQKQIEDRQAAKEKVFEEKRREAIIAEKEGFEWYKGKIDSLYGSNSPMRTPGSPWYIPMVEAGLQATRYIRTYDENIKIAKVDYKDLINQTNSNIYKLGVIKGKVDKIVSAAKKRRAAEALKNGIPMIDPSCYDLNGYDTVNDPKVIQGTTLGNKGEVGGVTQGPTTPTNKNPTQATGAAGNGKTQQANPTNATSSIKPDFEFTVKKDASGCNAIVTATNKSTGSSVGTGWGMKFDVSPTVYSGNSTNFSKTLPIYGSDSPQKGTITLTEKDSSKTISSISKNITLPKVTKMIQSRTGMTCQ